MSSFNSFVETELGRAVSYALVAAGGQQTAQARRSLEAAWRVNFDADWVSTEYDKGNFDEAEQYVSAFTRSDEADQSSFLLRQEAFLHKISGGERSDALAFFMSKLASFSSSHKSQLENLTSLLTCDTNNLASTIEHVIGAHKDRRTALLGQLQLVQFDSLPNINNVIDAIMDAANGNTNTNTKPPHTVQETSDHNDQHSDSEPAAAACSETNNVQHTDSSMDVDDPDSERQPPADPSLMFPQEVDSDLPALETTTATTATPTTVATTTPQVEEPQAKANEDHPNSRASSMQEGQDWQDNFETPSAHSPAKQPATPITKETPDAAQDTPVPPVPVIGMMVINESDFGDSLEDNQDQNRNQPSPSSEPTNEDNDNNIAKRALSTTATTGGDTETASVVDSEMMDASNSRNEQDNQQPRQLDKAESNDKPNANDDDVAASADQTADEPQKSSNQDDQHHKQVQDAQNNHQKDDHNDQDVQDHQPSQDDETEIPADENQPPNNQTDDNTASDKEADKSDKNSHNNEDTPPMDVVQETAGIEPLDQVLGDSTPLLGESQNTQQRHAQVMGILDANAQTDSSGPSFRASHKRKSPEQTFADESTVESEHGPAALASEAQPVGHSLPDSDTEPPMDSNDGSMPPPPKRIRADSPQDNDASAQDDGDDIVMSQVFLDKRTYDEPMHAPAPKHKPVRAQEMRTPVKTKAPEQPHVDTPHPTSKHEHTTRPEDFDHSEPIQENGNDSTEDMSANVDNMSTVPMAVMSPQSPPPAPDRDLKLEGAKLMEICVSLAAEVVPPKSDQPTPDHRNINALHTTPVSAVLITPAGSRIVSESTDGVVKMCHKEGAPDHFAHVKTWPSLPRRTLSTAELHVTKNSSFFATVRTEKLIVGKLGGNTLIERDMPQDVCFTCSSMGEKDCNIFVFGTTAGEITCFNFKTRGEQWRVLVNDGSAISSVALASDHSMIVATAEKSIHVLKAVEPDCPREPQPVISEPNLPNPKVLCISRNNKDYYIARGTVLYLYSLGSTTAKCEIDVGQEISCASIPAADESALVCVAGRSTVLSIKQQNSKLAVVQTFTSTSTSAKITCIAAHPKLSTTFVVGTDSGRVYVTDFA